MLADLVPGARARDVALIVGAAALTALCAQISFPVPGSPVPVTAQTFAVIVTAATLGAGRGVAGQLLYVGVGALGAPIYSDGSGGLHVLVGATGGYLVGFLVAAALVGRLAEHGQDRSPVRALAAFVAGQLAIFGIGVPWLAVVADLSARDAIAAGFTPFLLGGLVKGVLAAAAVPGAWRLVGRRR